MNEALLERLEAAQADKPLAEREQPLILVLDGVTDPHNLGACLRVADGAGAHAVIAPKDHAAGINATVAKVASGAAETVPYFMVTNLARTLNELKERNIWIIGTSDAAPQTLYQADLKGPVALVLVGVTLSQTEIGAKLKEALRLSLVKTVVHPMLMAGVGWALGMRGLHLSVMVVVAALPIGANVFLFSQRYRKEEDTVTAAVAVSTAMALVSVTVVMAVLPLLPA